MNVGIGSHKLWAGGGTGEIGNTHYERTGNSRDGKKDPVIRDRRGREQRRRTGKGRKVSVANEIHPGFPLTSRHIPHQTTFFSRPDHYRAYLCQILQKDTHVLKTPPFPHWLFDVQDSLDKRMHFLAQLSDFCPPQKRVLEFPRTD